MFDNSVQTIILNTIKQEENNNNSYCRISEGENIINSTLDILYKRNLTSLIVEGGTILLQSFIDAGCWDEARVITNKKLLIENGIAAPLLKNNMLIKKEQLLEDEICYYNNADAS